MKQYLIICLLLFVCRMGNATVGVESYIVGEKVNLCIVLNHATLTEYERLLYSARLKVMSEYIQTKIEEGILEDKKFEILCTSSILDRPHLELTQGKNGYYVRMSDLPDLIELLAIVEYFSRPDWIPVGIGLYREGDENWYFDYIDTFYKENTPKDVDASLREVWALGDDLRILYEVDSLQYQIKSTPLPIPVNANLPVKINDRYLLFDTQNVYVIENGRIILTYKFNRGEDDYRIHVYAKWVNLNYQYNEHWVLSYSYDENQFYLNEE